MMQTFEIITLAFDRESTLYDLLLLITIYDQDYYGILYALIGRVFREILEWR